VSSPGHILIIDDEEAECEALARDLGDSGYQVEWRINVDAALESVRVQDFDTVLLDLNIKDTDELALCRELNERRPDIPVMVMTAYGSLDRAVAAIRAGAYDFLTKPITPDVLRVAVERATRHRALRHEVKRLRDAADDGVRFEDIVGNSVAMQQVLDLVERVAQRDTSVLIAGESGTGKELVARALHTRSRRAQGPFVAINCAALPEPLFESELFGHAKGAFTDAKGTRRGLFLEATGGTLFLDEIGEMPIAIQPKLLRALQERTVRPVGSNQEVAIDVRIVAATNRDLEQEVESRRFREDLFYRINVVQIELPPLRARGNDILILAQTFVKRFAAATGVQVSGISRAAAEKLLAYHWPGNVRGLQNCMERAVALARHEEITVDDLPEKIRNHQKKFVVVATDDPSELLPMDEVERRYILRVLEAVKGNKKMAAQVLGFDRATLYRKLARYKIAGMDSPESSRKGNGEGDGSAR
jgi:DNA-binding NtrC family response regulator